VAGYRELIYTQQLCSSVESFSSSAPLRTDCVFSRKPDLQSAKTTPKTQEK
jgi:hypothetical protein